MPCGKMSRFAVRLLPERAALGWGQYSYNIIRLLLPDNKPFELYATTSASTMRMPYVMLNVTYSLLVGLLFKALLILIP